MDEDEIDTKGPPIIPILIGVIGLVAVCLAGLIFYLVTSEPSEPTFADLSEPLFQEDESFDSGSVDSAARIEIEKLRQQMEFLQRKVVELEGQIAKVDARASAGPAASQDATGSPGFNRDGPNQILDAYAQTVLIAGRRDLNKGLSVASPTFLEKTLGRPREVLSDKCEGMTNENLKRMLVLETVGPIRVRMLQPAVDSLKRVFENVKNTDPDLYARINTAGSLCVRQIRGTRGRTSTHSFGLSVDLNIDGKLDTLGDGKTQLGLTILADFFMTEGWFWGAAFSREDSMHFEVSREMVTKWREEGKI
jgi:hypothetical protein